MLTIARATNAITGPDSVGTSATGTTRWASQLLSRGFVLPGRGG